MLTMDFSWALNYPEIFKICSLFELTELLDPKRFCYRPLSCYLQEGPQCGLVALSMCTGHPSKENVQKLYQSAKELGYTYNGELFSAKYMQHLAQIHLDDVMDIRLYEGHLNTSEIREFLLNGGLILVPYDSDVTNNPGLHNGHKAHWAAISGAIETEDNFFVIGRHGKAKNISIWDLKDLDASNSQLDEFSPVKKQSDIDYKLPDGGINGPIGLKLKSVLISFVNS